MPLPDLDIAAAHEIQLEFAIARLDELRNFLSNIPVTKSTRGSNLPALDDPATTTSEDVSYL